MNKHDWKYKKLGDYIFEYSVKNKKNEDIPVYSVTNSQGFCQEYFSKEVASKDKSNYKIVPYGYFAYNPSRVNVGSIDWQHKEEKVIVSPLYNVFGVKSELTQKYLLYYLKCNSTINYINAIAIGTVRMNLKLSMLKKFTIPLPSVTEQEAIVAELDEINETIAELEQQIADLDNLKRSVFNSLFGDILSNEKQWTKKKLGEVCIIGTGATPSRSKENIYYNGDIPWVKTTEVHYEDIVDTEEKITPKAVEETNCKIYPSGTILMAMYGQGKTRGQIAKLRIDATTNQACAAIQIIDNNIITSNFLYESLWILYERIREMARGGNQANLNLDLVRSIPIILPPLTLQQEFASRIEAIEEAKAELNSQIAEMQKLLASRMDYYFD